MSTVPSSPGEAAQRQAFQPDTGKADDQPKPQKQQQDKHATAYVVLRLNTDRGASWVTVKTVNATSAKAAIQQVLDGSDDKDKAGSYVAVPERSWQPVTVKVETQTVVKFD